MEEYGDHEVEDVDGKSRRKEQEGSKKDRCICVDRYPSMASEISRRQDGNGG